LFLSVVIALGRLYRDTEITALSACGIRMARLIQPVFWVSVVIALTVACFSLFIRPWAWGQFFDLKARAKANFDMSRMKSGIFYEIENGERVIFADRVDDWAHRARAVFIHTRRNGQLQIIRADKATQFKDPATGNTLLVFHDGFQYDFTAVDQEVTILRFEQAIMALEPKEAIQEAYRIKAAPTGRLIRSDRLEEIAEYQWRITTPLSTVLLALLGATLGRVDPRQGKYAKIPAALMVFAVYYHLSAVMKKWVGQGVVAAMPGMWSVQILLTVLLLVCWLRPALSDGSWKHWTGARGSHGPDA
jgi:lipopolysaccharide export system permease protein